MEITNYSLVNLDGIIGNWSPEDMEMIFQLTSAASIQELILATQDEIDRRATGAEDNGIETQSLINGVAFLHSLIQANS
ncbi:hypothetical protein KBD71_03945 [Candidatus Woesebacteria bacterium]|nr:hypothetical protein [Candidatus Woesebacteria bacterium]